MSLHKHSTGHGRPSTPGSGLPAHAPQRCRGPRRAGPVTATPLSARRGCLPLARRIQRAAAARARMVNKVRLSAQPPADRSVQPLIQRHGWTAPASRWAARHCSWPPVGAATRSNGCCALPSPIRPPGGAQGRHRRRCALPVPLLPLTPLPPLRGGFAARCAPGGRSIGLLLAGLCAAAPAGQSARETPGCLPPPGGTCALHDPGSADAALPVAAALFFLLPRQRNVMRRSLLRQGRASRCSVLRSLDTRSLRIGSAAQGGRTTQMPQQPAASRPGS